MTLDPSKSFAIITGASTGLGKYFALELASQGRNTLLVALPNENVQAVVEQCKTFGVESYAYETDLTIRQNVLEFSQWVNDHFQINLLINNAGCGGTKAFALSDVNYIDSIIQLNVMATSTLTHQLLPNLTRNTPAYILNVSSMASFSPIGYKTVYPASKAFVSNFSRGLSQELKDCGVFVSVVHPGPMKTNSDATARIERQGKFALCGIVSPEVMARCTLEQLFKRNRRIIIGWGNKLQWMMLQIIPERIVLPILTRVIQREIKPINCTTGPSNSLKKH